VLQVALLLPLLLAFVALAVDVGLFYVQLGDLQATAAAAAAGAAVDLRDDPYGTALRLAEANMSSTVHGPVLERNQIEVGYWNGALRTFSANATPANAVRVTTRKTRGTNWLVGATLGLNPLNLSSQATAVLLPELSGAMSSRSSITMSGKATTGSYDSRVGPFNFRSPGSNGDLVANDSISLTGSVRIRGSLRADNISVGGSASVSGSRSDLRRPLTLPSVDTAAIRNDNDNAALPPIIKGNKPVPVVDANRNFTLNGNVNYSMPPGEYYFNDFSVGGQAVLTVSGPTTIYVTGNLDTSGGNMINSSQLPNNMRILMTGGTARINAGVSFYGLFYGPDTSITMNGNAVIYGAIVGSDVRSNGTAEIYFDEGLALNDLIPGLPKRSRIVQ
jgi:hypothetical protein